MSSHSGSKLKPATWNRQTQFASRWRSNIERDHGRQLRSISGPAKANQIDLIEPKVRGLVELGLPVVSPIRCLGLAEQVAQKLHACTGPAAAGRARDVLDILLIEVLGQLDYSAAANAARRVFAERATHPFPPPFAMPPEWRPELEAMAHELGFALTASAEIERRFLDLIRTLSDIQRPEPLFYR